MNQPALSPKTRVEKEVVDVIIDSLNGGDLTVEGAREVARLTLGTLVKIEQHEESVVQFYKDLASKYPIFNILYTKVKGEIVKSKELSAYRQALTAIHAGNVDEAHRIASLTIKQSAHEATNA